MICAVRGREATAFKKEFAMFAMSQYYVVEHAVHRHDASAKAELGMISGRFYYAV